MPGISHFSKEDIADKFAEVIRDLEAKLKIARTGLSSVIDFIAESDDGTLDDIAKQAREIAEVALTKSHAPDWPQIR
jgi:hypothetical protein